MRQAVVVIHGIGEQQPMGTIRSFADSVLGSNADGPKYYSRPDRLSDLLELRCLQARETRSPTDFYEYYWAYNIQGTKVWGVLLWVFHLMLRSPKDIPRNVRLIWALSWTLMSMFFLLVALGSLGQLYDSFKGGNPFTAIGGAIFIALSIVQFVLVSYVGDAARYLSPLPANVSLRQKIRSQGVQLLRALHQSGRYDRIIVVGHSLGSVIGYDMICRFWIENNEQLPSIETDAAVKEQIIKAMTAGYSAQPIIRDQLSVAGEALGQLENKGDAVSAFQQMQVRAWREQCFLGNPWRITDFITLGSPLAHAELFLAANKEEFASRKSQRELPSCPPERDVKGYAYSSPRPFVVGVVEQGDGSKAKKLYTPLILHHAAPFAVTRWTNIYFPVKWGILGDLVGGAVAPVFGPGVRDIAVRTNRMLGWTLLSHTSYWYCSRVNQSTDAVQSLSGNMPDALKALTDTLALKQLRKFTMRERIA